MTIVYNPFTDNLDYKGSSGGGGNVVGPGSSVDGDIAIFDGTTGDVLADSGYRVSDFLLLMGGTMLGPLYLAQDPLTPTEAATKAYVDATSGGAIFKQVVVAASTTNLTAIYNNGVLGVGATLTNSGALAAFTLDGVSLSVSDRVLIKNQTAMEENGVYTVTTVGSGAVAWVLTRATDYDEAAEILPGTVFPVMSGTVNANTSWIQSNTVVTVGTDPIFFSQFTYNAATFLQVLNNLSDLDDVPTARSNLGLGTLAVLNSPLPAINGGTAQTTYTTGDTLYASAANTLSKLGIGSAGQVLTVTAGIPSWQTPTTGTVTSVSGTLNRITSTGGATPVIDIDAGYVGQASITTLGTVTTGTWNATTIATTRGGTGLTSYATGDILYASASNVLSKLAAGSDGQVLTLAAGIPSWATPTTGTVTSVSGTLNRITSTGGATPVIDIAATYVGQTSLTTLGTVTTGTWNATVIDVTYGGTGRATLTNHGVLVGAGTSAITQLAAGSAGQVLQSGGASADPAYSTATYPSVATGTGKILRADGTNWVASTATYPDTAGTSGNVLTSDGTNWVSSAAPGAFTWTDVTGATQTLAVANGYVTDRGAGVTYTLPATAALGDQIRIVGKLGIAVIAQNANQQISISSSSTTVGVGGSLTATNVGDCIWLVCITAGASTVWRAESSMGNWTVV